MDVGPRPFPLRGGSSPQEEALQPWPASREGAWADGRPVRGQGHVGPLPMRVDKCDCGGITSPRACVFSARFFPRNTGTVSVPAALRSPL